MTPAAPAPPATTYGGGTARAPVELLDRVRRVEIRARRLLSSAIIGAHASVFRGRGIEFRDHREYAEGDDIRTIDWNVTARSNKTFIRLYTEERELTVYLLVDVSASGIFGSSGRSKLDAATELAAVLAMAAVRNNDRVGLLAFTDRVEKFLPPRKGRRHLLRLIRELLTLHPRGRGTDIAAALAFLARVQRRHAMVFLLSDFFAQDFAPTMRVAGRRHDLLAFALTDPAELDLPDAGLVRMEDAETGREIVVDTSDRRVRETYRQLASRAIENRERDLTSVRVDSVEVRTDQSCALPLYRLLQRRMRRS